MRFQRVRSYPGIVSPDLVQEHFARHYPLGRAVQELENIGFFLGQANLAIILGDQHLHGWFERIRA